jgi:hypothetical protein
VSDILFYDLGKLEDALAQRDALVNTLKGIAEFCSSDANTLGAIERLAHIQNTAVAVLALVSSQKEPS